MLSIFANLGYILFAYGITILVSVFTITAILASWYVEKRPNILKGSEYGCR